MANSNSGFGWCRLILYIISAFLAAGIANFFIKPDVGYGDVLVALLVFLGLFLLFVWLSRYICGMFGSKSSGSSASSHHAEASKQEKKDSHVATAGAATAAASAGHAVNSQNADEESPSEPQPELTAEPDSVQASADNVEVVVTDPPAEGMDDAVEITMGDTTAEGRIEAVAVTPPAEAKMTTDQVQAVRVDADSVEVGTAGVMPRNLKTSADEGNADNLKEIKGIGPKLEKLCNKLGIYYFNQIANWDDAEVAWMDSNLEGFKGRVTRDDWVGQAKILAKGGSTEFSKKVDDGKIY